MFLHITSARYLADYKVELHFNDGSQGVVDLEDSLSGPIFAPLKKLEYFKQFRLEGKTLSWENGADFAPEYLHELLPRKTAAN